MLLVNIPTMLPQHYFEGNISLFLQKQQYQFMTDRILEQYKPPLYCVLTCNESCIEDMYYYGFIVSIVLAGVCTLISLYNIFMHYLNFNNPSFQSKIIILLLLPPVYSLTSAFSFFSFTISTYLAIARTAYQLVAIFSFFYLLFAYLGFDHQKSQINEKRVYEIMRNENSEVPHDFPCVYFQKPYQISNWRKSKYLIHRCKKVVLLYIIAKIIAYVLLMMFQTAAGWKFVIPTLIKQLVYWIIGISSYVAYYYLMIIFNCLKNPLKRFRPTLKFSIITATLFFIFWQSCVFTIFQQDIVACFNQTVASYSRNRIIFQLQHIVINIEMLFVVFVCVEAFSFRDYVITHRKVGSISFIIKDIIQLFFYQLRLIKPKTFGYTKRTNQMETELQTISKLSKTKSNYSTNIKEKLDAYLKENYF